MGAPLFERHELGFSWLADDEETMARACHAIATETGVWVIDPVIVEGLEQRIAELGTPIGVIQLLDRHNRDCAELAERLGVPLHRLPFEGVPDSPFEVIRVVHNRLWREAALWWPERKALVVAEAVGSASYFCAGSEPLGVHPMLRPTPPRRLARYRPEHLLSGHGTGMHGPDTADALADALANARRRIPAALVSIVRS
jgi:hypothetical protein